MSRSSDAANSVVKAVEQACALYRVPVLRMQSRTFTVKGKGGRERPMFTGEWTDDLGVKHRRGMADLLAFPNAEVTRDTLTPPVPLWIECKAGEGRLSEDQLAFRAWAEMHGYYLLAQDSADVVLDWFRRNGVTR